MNKLMYDLLDAKAKTLPPYRAHKKYEGMKRWPLGRRTHSHKYFAEREENGQIVYDIYIGQYWDYHKLDVIDYNKLSPEEQKGWWYNNISPWNAVGYYSRHVGHHHRVATSRPDGTIEIVAHHLGQGVRTVLNEFGVGYLQASSKHGGVIWQISSSATGLMTIPMFKGLRFSMDGINPIIPIMHESSRYEVETRKVKRSAGRELMSKYANFLTVSGVMFKVMDPKSFVEQLAEIEATEVKGGYDYEPLIPYAESRIATDPVGAALAYMLALGVGWCRSFARNPNNGWNAHRLHEDIASSNYEMMKRKFSKLMYQKHDDVFERVTHSWEKRHFPSNDWGIDVFVNGSEVERYI